MYKYVKWMILFLIAFLSGGVSATLDIEFPGSGCFAFAVGIGVCLYYTIININEK